MFILSRGHILIKYLWCNSFMKNTHTKMGHSILLEYISIYDADVRHMPYTIITCAWKFIRYKFFLSFKRTAFRGQQSQFFHENGLIRTCRVHNKIPCWHSLFTCTWPFIHLFLSCINFFRLQCLCDSVQRS